MSGRVVPPLAGIAAIAAAVLAIQLSRTGGGEPVTAGEGARSGPGRAPTVLEPVEPARSAAGKRQRSARPDPALEDTDRPRRVAGLRTARRAARRFIAALLEVELERGGRRARRELRALATEPLADRLLAAPPRVPTGGELPPPGTVEGLELLAATRRTVELAAAIRRGGQWSGMVLRLTGQEDRWLVGDVR